MMFYNFAYIFGKNPSQKKLQMQGTVLNFSLKQNTLDLLELEKLPAFSRTRKGPWVKIVCYGVHVRALLALE